jgi:hypothetical protein
MLMQHEDREQRMDDDDSTPRSHQDDSRATQAPVVRLLANPRRVRRA